MREIRHHRLRRAVRLALCAGGIGAVWVGGVLLLGASSDARADDTVGARATESAGRVPSIDITPPPIVDPLTSGVSLPPLPVVPDLPGLPNLPDLPDLPHLPDLPDLPDLDDLPTVSVPPIVSELPVVPQLPTVPTVPAQPSAPIVVGPSPLSPLPADGRPTVGTDARSPASSGSDSTPARPGDPLLPTPWGFDATPVTPPSSPAPPLPSQVGSSSSSLLTPPPADRVSSPRAHFASFPEVAPPGRGPPSDLAQNVDTSPD